MIDLSKFEGLTTYQGRSRFHKYVGDHLHQKSFALMEAEILQAISSIADPAAEAAIQELRQPTKLIGH